MNFRIETKDADVSQALQKAHRGHTCTEFLGQQWSVDRMEENRDGGSYRAIFWLELKEIELVI